MGVVLVWAAAAALSACSYLGPPEGKKAGTVLAPAQGLGRVDDLLHYGDQFAALPKEAREQELEKALERYRSRQTPHNLFRAALLVTLSEDGDETAAPVRAGLRDYVKRRDADDRDDAALSLARLLLRVLDERARLEEDNAAQKRKLDELKAIEQKMDKGDKHERIQVPQ